MNVSMAWMEAMLGRALPAREAAERLTMLGAAVDAVEALNEGLEGVLVGLVERVEKHPNADRLSLCLVQAGTGEPIEVVCGAPNVRAGTKYPYAPVGTTLPGGFKLSRRKIRGVVSNGMLCSAKELGLGTDHEGILALATDAPPGTPLPDAIPIRDTRLVVDVTPNRPDLLCQRGIARELAAAYDLTVKLPAIPGAGSASAPRRAETKGSVGGVEVVLTDTEGCPRYLGAVIRGVTVGPSPEWLKARLLSVGSRPINNVVDATNYILHELNQPLHAFDIARLRGGTVIVRRANAGEPLVTLDDAERALDASMTAICDAEGPVAVGGVMGGKDSEVSPDTKDLFLECAYFDPKRIRATRMALKMSTDASYRFERGIDRQGMPAALRRAVELIVAVAGGAEVGPALDLDPRPAVPPTVFLRPERVTHLLGVALARSSIERHLARVGFTVAPKDERLAVQVPGWRPDVTREVDLIEEIARIEGYDTFPVEMRPFRPTAVPNDPAELLAARVRRALTGLGLHEARTLPLGAAGGPGAQAVRNPLSADEAYLRTDLTAGLVRSVEHNWGERVRDVRLFEIGRVFRCAGAGRVPTETLRLAAVFTGTRLAPHWSEAGKAPDLDLWDLKGMFEEAARLAGPHGSTVEPAKEAGWVLRDGDGHPCGWARILEADAPPWAATLLGFELDMAVGGRPALRYHQLPETPSVDRDLAVLVPGGVSAAAIAETIRKVAGGLLESLEVFDEYRPSGADRRSVAWRLVFRDPTRTLRDDEVDRVVTRTLDVLKEDLGVELRQS